MYSYTCILTMVA